MFFLLRVAYQVLKLHSSGIIWKSPPRLEISDHSFTKHTTRTDITPRVRKAVQKLVASIKQNMGWVFKLNFCSRLVEPENPSKILQVNFHTPHANYILTWPSEKPGETGQIHNPDISYSWCDPSQDSNQYNAHQASSLVFSFPVTTLQTGLLGGILHFMKQKPSQISRSQPEADGIWHSVCLLTADSTDPVGRHASVPSNGRLIWPVIRCVYYTTVFIQKVGRRAMAESGG